jgi:hypothetical protein
MILEKSAQGPRAAGGVISATLRPPGFARESAISSCTWGLSSPMDWIVSPAAAIDQRDGSEIPAQCRHAA